MGFKWASNIALTAMFVFTCVTQCLFYYFYIIFMSEVSQIQSKYVKEQNKNYEHGVV